MSLDIDQIALHQLIKRDEQNLELVLRESLLEPTATVVEMMNKIWSWPNCIVSIAQKIKPTACLMKRANWRRRCAGSVRAKKRSCRLAAPLPGACATNWQNIPLQKAVLCCFASIVIWRWNI